MSTLDHNTKVEQGVSAADGKLFHSSSFVVFDQPIPAEEFAAMTIAADKDRKRGSRQSLAALNALIKKSRNSIKTSAAANTRKHFGTDVF